MSATIDALASRAVAVAKRLHEHDAPVRVDDIRRGNADDGSLGHELRVLAPPHIVIPALEMLADHLDAEATVEAAVAGGFDA